MPAAAPRFRFACAPVSWGVPDDYGPAWEQPYEHMLDEMVAGGYTGTELGPYGYFPTDANVLRPVLQRKKLTMLSSFVPVPLADPSRASAAIEQIRKVGTLLAAMQAPLIVLADAQSPQRRKIAGRVSADGSQSLNTSQWREVARVISEAERVAADFGLDLVFHPHVATYVETPRETAQLFDAASSTKMGLCLDTGHCYYGGGDPVSEGEKYKHLLRYVHIKDINPAILAESNRRQLDFDQAVEAGVFSQIGAGCVDFPAFFRMLVKNGYSGWLVVEQDVKFGATTVPPAESMAASLRYLHGVVNALP
ncbi:MAG TPA: TIM barrel protein [Bryobacteraceae bacterium]|nr:TIM barrel protein [Bryobacteraceae bacterium]